MGSSSARILKRMRRWGRTLCQRRTRFYERSRKIVKSYVKKYTEGTAESFGRWAHEMSNVPTDSKRQRRQLRPVPFARSNCSSRQITCYSANKKK